MAENNHNPSPVDPENPEASALAEVATDVSGASKISPRKKGEIVRRILAAMLYPSTNQRTINSNTKKFLSVFVALKLAHLKKKEKKYGITAAIKNSRAKLENEFEELGGILRLANAETLEQINSDLYSCWDQWCNVYFTLDIIHRSSLLDPRPEDGLRIGLNQARWLAILTSKEHDFPISDVKKILINDWNTYAPVAHLIVATMRVCSPTDNPPNISMIRTALKSNFELFFGHATQVQDFCVNNKIKKSESFILDINKIADVRSYFSDDILNNSLSPPLDNLDERFIRILSKYNVKNYDEISRFIPQNKLKKDCGPVTKEDMKIILNGILGL